jgi:hypothetical protein
MSVPSIMVGFKSTCLNICKVSISLSVRAGWLIIYRPSKGKDDLASLRPVEGSSELL